MKTNIIMAEVGSEELKNLKKSYKLGLESSVFLYKSFQEDTSIAKEIFLIKIFKKILGYKEGKFYNPVYILNNTNNGNLAYNIAETGVYRQSIHKILLDIETISSQDKKQARKIYRESKGRNPTLILSEIETTILENFIRGKLSFDDLIKGDYNNVENS